MLITHQRSSEPVHNLNEGPDISVLLKMRLDACGKTNAATKTCRHRTYRRVFILHSLFSILYSLFSILWQASRACALVLKQLPALLMD